MSPAPKPADLPEASSEHEDAQGRNYTKIIVGLVLLSIIILVIVDSLTTGVSRDAIESFLNWVEDNVWLGVAALTAVYALATVLFIPGSLLTVGSGFVLTAALGALWKGVLLGSLAVVFGASLGATGAFIISRYLLRETVQTRLADKYAVWQAVDAALEERGFFICLLLRLSPVVPFTALNYLLGVTAVPLKDYVYALAGITPGTVLYVFLGASAGSLAGGSDTNPAITFSVIGVGVVFGFAAIALMTRFAKKKLNEILDQRNEADPELGLEVDEPAVGE